MHICIGGLRCLQVGWGPRKLLNRGLQYSPAVEMGPENGRIGTPEGPANKELEQSEGVGAAPKDPSSAHSPISVLWLPQGTLTAHRAV
jgi:hypothetical protein